MDSKIVICLLATSALLMAGCASPAVRTYGIGLTLPKKNPQPGPFTESAAERGWFAQSMQASLKEFSGPCIGSKLALNAARSLQQERYLQTAMDGEFDCLAQLDRSDPIDEGRAVRWMTDGVDGKVYRDNHTAAREAQNTTFEALGKMPLPRNATTAQFQAVLWERAYSNSRVITTAEHYFEGYVKEPSASMLVGAIVNLQGPRAAFAFLMNLIATTHWDGSPACTAQPGLQETYARVSTKRDAAIAAARHRWPASEANFISNPLGLLVKELGPETDFFYERGSVVGLLWLEGQFDWYAAMSNAKPPYASREEAGFLLAKYRSETRTLYTEYQTQGLVDDLDIDPWDEAHPEGPLHYHMVAALKWTFGAYACP